MLAKIHTKKRKPLFDSLLSLLKIEQKIRKLSFLELHPTAINPHINRICIFIERSMHNRGFPSLFPYCCMQDKPFYCCNLKLKKQSTIR